MQTGRYHLSANGPRLCRAGERPCPLGGEHYSSVADAATAYDTKMLEAFSSFEPHKKTLGAKLKEKGYEVREPLTYRAHQTRTAAALLVKRTRASAPGRAAHKTMVALAQTSRTVSTNLEQAIPPRSWEARLLKESTRMGQPAGRTAGALHQKRDRNRGGKRRATDTLYTPASLVKVGDRLSSGETVLLTKRVYNETTLFIRTADGERRKVKLNSQAAIMVQRTPQKSKDVRKTSSSSLLQKAKLASRKQAEQVRTLRSVSRRGAGGRHRAERRRRKLTSLLGTPTPALASRAQVLAKLMARQPRGRHALG